MNASGQLYTIEGLAAAILMIVTAYIILNTTTLFTPGETHIVDLQLEQLGNDALAMMDTPDSASAAVNPPIFKSNLSRNIENITGQGGQEFSSNMSDYLRTKTDGQMDNTLQFNASIITSTPSGSIRSVPFASSNNRMMTGREHAVTVSRLVLITVPDPVNPPLSVSYPNPGESHYVLMEVNLWRD